jgi:hypothetical protein
MHPADLEAVVHRELRQLPSPGAPPTLLPCVLTTVRAWSRRPWYERAWLTWPMTWQAASVAALILVVAGGVTLIPHAATGADRVASMFASDMIGSLSTVANVAEATATAARALWRAMIRPLAPYAFALVALMCLACGLFGTALNHVLSERMLQR